jgi:hypothetical protein
VGRCSFEPDLFRTWLPAPAIGEADGERSFYST